MTRFSAWMQLGSWDELVRHNPMLIEITRFRRKFLTMNASSAMAGVALAMIGVCYVGMMCLVLKYAHDVDPFVFVFFQTVLFIFVAPLLMHSAIAGERERRSWDLLLVAPITKGQIVIGKFMGALSAVAVGLIAFLFPILITLAAQSEARAKIGSLIQGELVSASFTIFVCSLALFFSARVKRSFMALGTTVVVLALALLVFPMFVTLVQGPGSQAFNDVLLYLHPIYALIRIYTPVNVSGEYASPAQLFGIPQTLVYLGLTLVALGWTIQTLHFAENEVKFIPQAKTDA